MSGKRELLTTGYAGHDPESFLAKLHEHGVETVIDVRQNPVSRKKGFSRSKLSEFLTAQGVGYLHVAALGVPVSLRQLLREGECELAEYFDGFRDHLSCQEEALDDLYDLAIRSRCCLICLEHHAEECHRSVVAEVVASRNGHKLGIKHV
jgi:uncharacterized protein (DUF488 family)